MADNNAVSCLVGFMDHLWFHQVVLFSDPSTSNSLSSKILQPPSMSMADSEELSYSMSNDSQTPLISEEDSSAITNKDEFNKQESDEKETTCATPEERPTRLNLSARKARSHSSSPSNVKRSSNLGFSDAGGRLHKTMSCKSLCELELEEVKGFMDLGFIFNKEHLNKRTMSVIPGLQRLELSKSIEEKDIVNISSSADDEITRDYETERDEGEGEGEKKPLIIRPYLSEAWLIKRPDSPLLNLRIPRVSSAADMKKHLKYWARTVASVIELEG